MRIIQHGLVLMSVALFGCVSGVEELAAEGKWTEVGYRDGIKGQHSRSRGDLSKLGSANQAEYDAGYLEGITDYCNPNAAYQIGLSGQFYQGVCEGTEHGQKFRMEWQRGWNESN
jgi:hypothetical protein